MAKFDLPDDGVSFKEREDAFYNDGGTKPPLSNLDEYQDPARQHDTQMVGLRMERERRRHE